MSSLIFGIMAIVSLCAVSASRAQEDKFVYQPNYITVNTGWAGNSLPGAGERVIPSEMNGITVAPNGTFLGNTFWDETHNNVPVFDSEGKFLSRAPFMVGEGYFGGNVTAASGSVVIVSQSVKDSAQDSAHPPKGSHWSGISFRGFDMKPVQTVGAVGNAGNQRIQSGSFLPILESSVPGENSKLVTDAIQGLAVYVTGSLSPRRGENFTLLMSETLTDGGMVHAYAVSVDTSGQRPKVTSFREIRKWKVPKAGPIAIDTSGNVWVGAEKGGKHVILGLKASGGELGKEIVLSQRARGIAIHDNELWVANKEVPMPIYKLSASLDRPSRTFGTSPMQSRKKGEIEGGTVISPTSVGLDARGRVYIVSRVGSTAHYASFESNGKLRWRRHAVGFSISGGFAEDGEVLYAANTKLTRKNGRWDVSALTIDNERFLKDPRNFGGAVDSVRTFTKDEQLFVWIFFRRNGALFRKEANSEILIPVGFFKSGSEDIIPLANQPRSEKWIWTDRNGDGKTDANEFTAVPWGAEIQGFNVDSTGGVTVGIKQAGIGRLELTSMQDGVPSYVAKEWSKPADYLMVVRAIYLPAEKSILLTGFSANNPGGRFDGRLAGNYMSLHKVGSSGIELSKVWGRQIFYTFTDGPRGIESIDVADELIVLGNRITSELVAHNTYTGQYLFSVKRDTKLHGEHSSWLDLTDTVHVVKLSNGSYRVNTQNVYCQNMSLYDIPAQIARP